MVLSSGWCCGSWCSGWRSRGGCVGFCLWIQLCDCGCVIALGDEIGWGYCLQLIPLRVGLARRDACQHHGDCCCQTSCDPLFFQAFIHKDLSLLYQAILSEKGRAAVGRSERIRKPPWLGLQEVDC